MSVLVRVPEDMFSHDTAQLMIIIMKDLSSGVSELDSNQTAAVLGHFGHGHFGHGRFGQDILATDISATDISANGHFGHGHFGHGKK